MELINEIIGKQIRTYRKLRGKSLVDFSDDTGISKSSLSRIEKGQQYIDVETLMLVARKLDISVDCLINSMPVQKLASSYNELKACKVYYLGKRRTIETSLLAIRDGEVSFYKGIDDLEKYSEATHIYKGMKYEYDNIIYIYLENVIAKHDVLNVAIHKPLKTNEIKKGFIMGYREELDEKPLVFKAVFSKVNLSMSDIQGYLCPDKKRTYKYIKEYNSLVL